MIVRIKSNFRIVNVYNALSLFIEMIIVKCLLLLLHRPNVRYIGLSRYLSIIVIKIIVFVIMIIVISGYQVNFWKSSFNLNSLYLQTVLSYVSTKQYNHYN